MKSLQRANINALISSLIWGLGMTLMVKTSMSFVTDAILTDVLWYGGNFLVMMLYPILVSLILRRKIDLWINVCFFSMIGGVYSILILYVINAFQLKVWTNVGFGVFGLGFIGYMLISNVARNYAIQQEWDSPHWEKLNQSSLIDFFFLRFDTTDGNMG